MFLFSIKICVSYKKINDEVHFYGNNVQELVTKLQPQRRLADKGVQGRATGAVHHLSGCDDVTNVHFSDDLMHF